MIDVNVGRMVMGVGEDGEEVVLWVNIVVVELVVRTLRLRDIGGFVMFDLIDMYIDDVCKVVEIVFEVIVFCDCV